MKKILSLCLSALLLLTSLPLAACQDKDDTPATTDNPNAVQIIKDSASEYVIVRADAVDSDSPEKTASFRLQTMLEEATGVKLERKTDWINYNEDKTIYENAKEILIGRTKRKESQAALAELAFNEFIIKVDGPKIVICGACEAATLQAVEYFGANYLTTDSTLVELPKDFSVKGYADFTTSSETGAAFETMGATIIRGFNSKFYNRGDLPNTEFWDAAEILEAYIDAYEQTGEKTYLTYIEAVAEQKFGANNANVDWCWNNAYNDDIAWGCIAFARIYLLTKEEKYLTIAKNNFDTMYRRAASDDMGGGLWWTTANSSKNSCIQCPASIAACLIGKATGDDGYYEKAKAIMDWEFENMFTSSGAVYDSKSLSGEVNTWASTYNQGTFIGACTLLHEKYGDEIYLTNAAKAAAYSMKNLTNGDGILNGETNDLNLIGFKGILVRWIYRYAEYTNDIDILMWLQKNADVAFSNRNSSNLIWTAWADETPDNIADLDIYGFSPAIAIFFNCQQWW